jgi:hypothetical protein
MTLPTSGSLRISQIYTEFGAPNRTPITDLVRGGAYIPQGGGVNSGIPTVPPIAISDFYGSEGNPTEVHLENVLLPQGEVLVLAGNPLIGLFVEAHDISSPTVEDDEKYVVDMRVKCGTGLVDGGQNFGPITIDSVPFASAFMRMRYFLGLTSADPATSSPQALILGATSGRVITLYNTDTDFGYMQGYTSLADIHYERRSSGSVYRDEILPTESQYLRIRQTRGTASDPNGGPPNPDYGLDHLNHMYTDDGFSSLWETLIDQVPDTGISPAPWANGGWLILYNIGVSDNAAIPVGNCDMDIEFCRVAINTTTPPW